VEELVSSAGCPDVDVDRDTLSLFTLLNKESIDSWFFKRFFGGILHEKRVIILIH
jgi:hypothetical protein